MLDTPRVPVVAVIGAGSAGPALLAQAERLGGLLIDAGFRIVTGGLGGVMAAASRGARGSERHEEGRILGILPGVEASAANPWVDVVLPTGLGLARNLLVVSSSDAVVALGGGSGTLSELALAWQLGRPIVALDTAEGWASTLAGQALDSRRDDRIHQASDPAQAVEKIRSLLSSDPEGQGD